MAMNAGPEYFYYYQVAKTIVTLYVCLLLGSSIPMLYLVGCLAIVNQYISDRLLLAYFHRRPPMYTNRLTMRIIDNIMIIPIFALSILFWQYTNRQMFENKIDNLKYDSDIRLSHHKVENVRWKDLHSAQRALLSAVILMLTFHILRKLVSFVQKLTTDKNRIDVVT